MSLDALPGATYLRIAVACLLAATMFVLPSLVRATQNVRDGKTSAPIRLNRGFEKPPSKAVIVPPADDAPVPAVRVDLPVRAPRVAPIADEPLPRLAFAASPDPLRGPPPDSRS